VEGQIHSICVLAIQITIRKLGEKTKAQFPLDPDVAKHVQKSRVFEVFKILEIFVAALLFWRSGCC
jgi:hypothetical protein